MQVPVVSGGKSAAAAKWESRTVYQPNVAILNGTIYDFYNAAGTNEYGHGAVRTCACSALRD